jgi:CubicO group peptidase (beta-lactamase class C family)
MKQPLRKLKPMREKRNGRPNGFKILFATLALLLLRVAAQGQADQIDDYIRSRMELRHIPGLSVAVVKEGKVLLAKGYGLANVELSVPATEHTVYQLASITKQFTATAVLMLIEEGKISLDDVITKHLDGLPATWSGVTIRHLLNHTSGIKSYTSAPNFSKTARKDYTKEEIIKLIADAPIDFAPGDRWAYNNTGYFLLGMLIEKVSGKEYGAFLNERIFQPLAMTSTRVNELTEIIKNRATGYTWQNNRLWNGEYVSPTQPFSAGALISTVLDLTKWDAALHSEKVLKQSSLEQMWTPTKLNDGRKMSYGFGWYMDVYRTRRRIVHGGGIQGFSTYICRFLDDRLTVIVLANQDGGRTESLAAGIAEFFIPALRENAPKPLADDVPKITQFLKEVVIDFANGIGDPDRFTPEAQQFFFPQRIKEGKRMLGSFGPLKSFELMEETIKDKNGMWSCKAVFGSQIIRLDFTLSEEGKIAGIGIRLQ